jgi:hypothetical protein
MTEVRFANDHGTPNAQRGADAARRARRRHLDRAPLQLRVPRAHANGLSFGGALEVYAQALGPMDARLTGGARRPPR